MEVILSLIFAIIIGFLVWVATLDRSYSLMAGIISTVAVFIICLGLFAHEEKTDLKEWNNGMCPTCEIEWDFANVSGMYANRYNWICPNCNKIITLADQY